MERIEEYEGNRCLCSKDALKKQHLITDLCYRYRQGEFKCEASTDPKYAVYFDVSSCECKIETAIPCGISDTNICKDPFSWYKNDSETQCLCTGTFECSKCSPQTIVEDFKNGICICRDLNENEKRELHKKYKKYKKHRTGNTLSSPKPSAVKDISSVNYCDLH
jgi:hypothetical protein